MSATRELKDVTERATTADYGITKLAADGATTAGLAVQGSDSRLVASSALPAAIHAATDKATPVDADELPLADSAAAFGLKKLTWANLKATAKTYFDTLYQPTSARLATLAALTRTRGALVVGGASDWQVLALGAAGQRVKSDGTDLVAGDDFATLTFVIDGGGNVVASGVKGDLVIPDDYTIVGVTLLADQSGSIVVDLWRCTYAQFDAGATHPVAGDKLTASAPPTISAATKGQDTTLTGWTTSLSAGEVLRFVVSSATTVTRVSCALRVKKRS